MHFVLFLAVLRVLLPPPAPGGLRYKQFNIAPSIPAVWSLQ